MLLENYIVCINLQFFLKQRYLFCVSDLKCLNVQPIIKSIITLFISLKIRIYHLIIIIQVMLTSESLAEELVKGEELSFSTFFHSLPTHIS